MFTNFSAIDLITSSKASKVIKELKPLREEQKAIDENYKKLDERMDNVETFAEEAAKIVDVEFTKG